MVYEAAVRKAVVYEAVVRKTVVYEATLDCAFSFVLFSFALVLFS